MKKKLLLTLAMIALFVCVFAICVSAAPQNYQSYEVELVSGEKITVYQAEAWDRWQGRIWITDATYIEAPVDDEGTYATVDWAQIKVLDFTNAWGHVYNSTTGEYELERGTNGAVNILKTSFTPANAVNLEKVITGAATAIQGAVFSSMPALKEVVIDSALTNLSYDVFNGCQALTTITFSGERNLKTIGQQTFLNCTALEKVDFLGSVTSMGNTVFGNCTSLKSVQWPSTITTIPNGTFDGCKALQFEIPSYITSIGSNAFKNCDALVSVTIPDGVTSLGGFVFSNCDNLEEIIISDNSQISNKIVGMAEYCPKLTSIRIPPLVTDIGYDNFRGCTSLAEIIWPNNLLTISGIQNFTNTAIKKITIPDSVTYLHDGNFSNLEEINYGASMTYLGGGNLASKNLKRVYIPGSITSIASNLLGYSNAKDSSMNITFIFSGTREEAIALQALARAAVEGTNNAPNMSKLYDAVLVSAWEYDVKQEPNGFTLVYGYSAENDYVSDIIEFKGYSYNPSVGVVVGFAINHDALEECEEKLGKTVDLGVVFVKYDSLKGETPLDENGEPITLDSGRIIKRSLSNMAIKAFDFGLTTPPTEALCNTKYVIAGYVSCGDTVVYFQENGAMDTVTGVSYNEIIDLIGADVPDLPDDGRDEFEDDCIHIGGSATCTTKAICEICGEYYGDEPSGHQGGIAATCTTKAICKICGEYYGNEPSGHQGGTATCTEEAICTVCGVEYGEPLGHQGGTAICTETAVCEICGSYYGGNGHTYDVANYNCSTCGATFVILSADDIESITASHEGGGSANLDKLFDGDKTTTGIYVSGDKDYYPAANGDYIEIVLKEETLLQAVILWTSGNWTTATIQLYDEAGNEVEDRSVWYTSAVISTGDSYPINVALAFEGVSVKTIRLTASSIKWNDGKTLKTCEIELVSSTIVAE